MNHIGLDRGGAEIVVRQLHRDLHADDFRMDLVSLEACSTDGIANAISLGARSAYDPRALWRLASYARSEIHRGDVVHAHLFPTSAYVAILAGAGIIRAPCMFTEHSTSNRRRETPIGRSADRAIYPAFARIVAISGGVRDALAEAYPSVAERITVVPNGCALPFDQLPAARVGNRAVTILSVGRLTRAKNHAASLAALAKLTDQRFCYVIVGDGELRSTLVETTQRLGLSDKVTFAGYQSDISSYLRSADIFLLPSLWEGFGLAAVEAMNAGLPIVAADVPGLRDVVGEPGECGLYVDPRCEAAIGNAVLTLVGSPALRVEMGRRGFERARRFDNASMTAAYAALYRELSSQGEPHVL